MLDKDISLTIRIPDSLNDSIIELGKSIGFTRTNFIRISIHKFLHDSPRDLSLVNTTAYSNNDKRFVLNLNNTTYSLLEDASKKYDISVNSAVLRICILALKHYSKLSS